MTNQHERLKIDGGKHEVALAAWATCHGNGKTTTFYKHWRHLKT
jgi:hypothetical protein